MSPAADQDTMPRAGPRPSMSGEELKVINAAYADTRIYERHLSRLLMAFISSGLVYLLGPGSFLGLWNLFAISHRETAGAVPAAWLQAHAHAEVYGWVGSFILGIGFHSLTRLRHARVRLGWGWTSWSLWTVGVGLRWFAGVAGWHWRVLLPVSAVLELAAFAIFQRTIWSTHKPQPGAAKEPKEPMPGWVMLVLTGALGFLLTLVLNLAADFCLGVWGSARTYTPGFDLVLVELITWAFLVPFIFGFSTRWLPVFAGFRSAPAWMPKALVACLACGVIAAVTESFVVSAAFWLAAALIAVVGLHPFQPAAAAAKLHGIHASFPMFLRLAYAWLVIAAGLGMWSALMPGLAGLGGASRHALTVGFIAGMVLTIGPRILPAFSGMKALYSPRLMLLTLALLEIGCLMRVSGEMLAYPGWWLFAWRWLPLSATLEVSAFTLFATNIALTLMQPPAHLQRAAAENRA